MSVDVGVDDVGVFCWEFVVRVVAGVSRRIGGSLMIFGGVCGFGVIVRSEGGGRRGWRRRKFGGG